MKKYYTAYVLLDCPYCEKAINLLTDKKLPFIAVIMDMNEEYVQQIKKDMNMKTVPIIVEHSETGTNHLIGGFDDLNKYLESNNGT